MQGLTLFNLNLTHLLDAFLETAVPMIAGLAEVCSSSSPVWPRPLFTMSAPPSSTTTGTSTMK